jgi:hypothetical protein
MALNEIETERCRQLLLQSAGKFKYTLSDRDVDPFVALGAIMEELGEASTVCLVRAGLATDDVDTSDKNLRRELSQIAALALAWMEKLYDAEMEHGPKAVHPGGESF